MSPNEVYYCLPTQVAQVGLVAWTLAAFFLGAGLAMVIPYFVSRKIRAN